MNQLKMFCTLLFQVTKTIDVGCKTCISTKTSSDIQLHLFSVFCLRPHTETRHYKLCMRNTPPPLDITLLNVISLLKHNTIINRISKLLKFDGMNKNPKFQLRYQAKKYSTPLPNAWLDIKINCIFSYHNIDHKWVLYLYRDNEPCFKRLYHQSL